MTVVEAAALVIAVLQVWTVWKTKALEHEIHWLNIGLDQSVQRLQRAQKLVRQITATYLYLLGRRHLGRELIESHLIRSAELSADQGELWGLASAINDEELLKLVHETHDFRRMPDEERHYILEEMELRNHAQRLHTKLSQLLEETTRRLDKTPK